MSKQVKSKMVDELFEAILLLKNSKESYKFFEDLATVAEIQSLAQRLSVAKMLDAGLRYEDIVEKTGASTATISRVKRFLDYGADGYRLILDRLKKNQ